MTPEQQYFMSFKVQERIGRNVLLHFFFSTHKYLKMILSNLSLPRLSGCLNVIVPALICGCSEEIHHQELLSTTLTKTSLKPSVSLKESTLDIFAFENDRFKRLDAYQRMEDVTSGIVGISSTNGEKIFFLCLNGQKTKYEWGMISSYSSLQSIYCDLEQETLIRQTMTGETRMTAGKTAQHIAVSPLTSEVYIENLGYDFSGTPYPDLSITEMKVYLTNVSASCPILYTETYRPNRIINTGCLNPKDIMSFTDPEIIVQEVPDMPGGLISHPDISLLCYPNPEIEESPGSPYTRLVIEGTIDSRIYYWPITINKGMGVGKGERYVYDIMIRRKGVDDPDIPIDGASIDIGLKIKPWTEKEEYSVSF